MKKFLLPCLAALLLLAPCTAAAGWGDALKQAGTNLADQQAKEAGVDAYLAPVTAAMQETGTAASFDANDYITEKVLDSMFHYMGEKETALRESGGAGASALL